MGVFEPCSAISGLAGVFLLCYVVCWHYPTCLCVPLSIPLLSVFQSHLPLATQVLIYDELDPATQTVQVKCFVLFQDLNAAVQAQAALQGKNFGGRRVGCQFFAEADFIRILES